MLNASNVPQSVFIKVYIDLHHHVSNLSHFFGWLNENMQVHWVEDHLLNITIMKAGEVRAGYEWA